MQSHTAQTEPEALPETVPTRKPITPSGAKLPIVKKSPEAKQEAPSFPVLLLEDGNVEITKAKKFLTSIIVNGLPIKVISCTNGAEFAKRIINHPLPPLAIFDNTLLDTAVKGSPLGYCFAYLCAISLTDLQNEIDTYEEKKQSQILSLEGIEYLAKKEGIKYLDFLKTLKAKRTAQELEKPMGKILYSNEKENFLCLPNFIAPYLKSSDRKNIIDNKGDKSPSQLLTWISQLGFTARNKTEAEKKGKTQPKRKSPFISSSASNITSQLTSSSTSTSRVVLPQISETDSPKKQKIEDRTKSSPALLSGGNIGTSEQLPLSPRSSIVPIIIPSSPEQQSGSPSSIPETPNTSRLSTPSVTYPPSFGSGLFSRTSSIEELRKFGECNLDEVNKSNSPTPSSTPNKKGQG